MSDKNTRLQLRCSPDFVGLIDDWRARKRPLPSQSEAVRTLVARGIVVDRYLDTILKNSVARLADRGLFSAEADPEIYERFQMFVAEALDQAAHFSLETTPHDPQPASSSVHETTAPETHDQDSCVPKRRSNSH